jgi:hypothetical protein
MFGAASKRLVSERCYKTNASPTIGPKTTPWELQGWRARRKLMAHLLPVIIFPNQSGASAAYSNKAARGGISSPAFAAR